MHQYFYEDQVYRVDKKGSVKFGLVVENEVSKFFISLENIFLNIFSIIFLIIVSSFH